VGEECRKDIGNLPKNKKGMKTFSLFRRFLEEYRSRGLKGTILYFMKKIRYKLGSATYPKALFIEITSKCNLNCSICWWQKADAKRERHWMTFRDFRKIVDDTEFFCESITLSFNGEPLLNNDIYSMITYAKRCGICVEIHTNGMLLNEKNRRELLKSMPDEMVISFDGATRETYESIRIGGNFDVVVRNIRDLVKERNSHKKKKPRVEMQMVVNKQNVGEIAKFEKLGKFLKVDGAYLKTLYINQTASEDYIAHLRNEYLLDGELSRYKINSNGKLLLKKAESPCPYYQGVATIMCDGKVVMCCFDLYGEYVFGNVLREHFRKIWMEKNYRKFREVQMKNRKLKICQECVPSSDLTKRLF